MLDPFTDPPRLVRRELVCDQIGQLSEIALHYRLKNAYEIQLVSNFKGEVYAALAANL